MRRSAEEAAQTRADLVKAGVTYFAAHGYAEATLNAIAEELGVTRGAIYHHFGNKSGLFAAVVEEVMADLRSKIESKARNAGGGWPGIEAGCDVFLEAAAEPSFRRMVLLDAPAVLGWTAWKAIDDRTTGLSLHHGLKELANEGRLITDDVEALATGLSGAMNELSLWIAGQSSTRKAIARAKEATRLLLDACQV